jgi:hypothetical protein
MWDDFFNTYRLSNRRNYYTRSWIFDNRQDPVFELYRLIQQAMDEAVPEEKPEEPEPQFTVVATKTVQRNGNTYRVTVEKLDSNPGVSETPEEPVAEIKIDEETIDFDEDTKEDLA